MKTILHTITRQDTGKGGKVSRITAKMREKEKRKDETELTQTLISILVKGAQIERASVSSQWKNKERGQQ